MDIPEAFRNLGLDHVNPILQAILVFLLLKSIIYFLTPTLQERYSNVIAFFIGVPNDRGMYHLLLRNQRLERHVERLERSIRSLEVQQRGSIASSDEAINQLQNYHQALIKRVDQLHSRRKDTATKQLRIDHEALVKDVDGLRSRLNRELADLEASKDDLSKLHESHQALSQKLETDQSRASDTKTLQNSYTNLSSQMHESQVAMSSRIDGLERQSRTLDTSIQHRLEISDLQTKIAISDVRLAFRDEFGPSLSEIPRLDKRVTELELTNDDKRRELNNFAKRFQQLEGFCTGLAAGLNKVPGHVLKKYWGEEYRTRFLHGGWKGGE
ncbi:MAG: hypothetical protein Q9219_007239 [cf. Caloplaca sp. 3 TL-2023]